MRQICRIFLAVCVFALVGHAQSTKTTSDPQQQEELNKQRIERDLESRISNMRRLNNETMRGDASELPADYRVPAVMSKRKIERTEAVKKILSPNAEDSSRYQTFLREPNTGLFRLFPDFNCISKGVVRVDGKCADAIPGTWFYSFRADDYSDDTYFDVRLKDGNLVGGGFLSQALLVSLGDVPLETVSLATTGGMKFLVDFKPETQFAEVKKQSSKIAAGVEADGFKYLERVKASENTTYAVRLIAYRSENKVADRFFRIEPNAAELKHLVVNYDKRADMILAFRVLRQDADGNITILWKQLSRQPSPKIVFEKNEKLSDIR